MTEFELEQSYYLNIWSAEFGVVQTHRAVSKCHSYFADKDVVFFRVNSLIIVFLMLHIRTYVSDIIVTNNACKLLHRCNTYILCIAVVNISISQKHTLT